MHFAGIFLRRLDASNEWLATLDRVVEPGPGDATIRSWRLGRIRVIADSRLTRAATGPHGLLVNSGSLIPAAHASVATAVGEPALLREYLTACRGNFAGAHASPDGERLTLFSDLLGTHPVYFADLADAVAFSTSQRTLLEILRGRLSIDIDGLLETCTFGFPLADRTAYREIRCMDAAQILHVDAAGTRSTSYFSWRALDIPPTTDVAGLARRAHSTFSEAIRARQQPDSLNYTLLSGGMDSRAIAATQTALGVRPTTLSISHPRALDAELARQAANALGCPFSFHSIDHSAFYSVGGLAKAVHDLLARSAPVPDKCVRIWSGDGGRVGLGGVYLSDALLQQAAEKANESVAATYRAENNLSGPSRRLFSAALDVASFAQRAVVNELGRFETPRKTQIPYLFLLLNDQRRHLHYFFELDMTVPLEFVTPFWDGHFIRLLLECPDRQLLYHRFYALFFEQLPAAARQVPWQTYPGHVPCPLPMPHGFEYNWDHAPRPADLVDAHMRARRVLRACASGAFPSKMLRRAPTAAAALAVLGSRDPARAYLVHHAETVLRCAATTNRTG